MSRMRGTEMIEHRGSRNTGECQNRSAFSLSLLSDIRRELPGAGCFSCGNLYYMRWFFELYCMRPILPPTWGIIERKG